VWAPCRKVRRGTRTAGNALPGRRRCQIHASPARSIATRSGTWEAARGQAAGVHGASGPQCLQRTARPADLGRGSPRPRTECLPRVRRALRGVPIASHLGSVRLDTPLFSGRVEVAKNDANPRASEICRQLYREWVPGHLAVADGPQSGVLWTDQGDFCARAKGPAGSGQRPSGGCGADRGAQGVVLERVLAAASQGKSSEGSLSQAAEPSRARHRLCSSKRGEATHHGAEPVSEEKVE
jgi:hypothetical protein